MANNQPSTRVGEAVLIQRGDVWTSGVVKAVDDTCLYVAWGNRRLYRFGSRRSKWRALPWIAAIPYESNVWKRDVATLKYNDKWYRKSQRKLLLKQKEKEAQKAQLDKEYKDATKGQPKKAEEVVPDPEEEWRAYYTRGKRKGGIPDSQKHYYVQTNARAMNWKDDSNKMDPRSNPDYVLVNHHHYASLEQYEKSAAAKEKHKHRPMSVTEWRNLLYAENFLSENEACEMEEEWQQIAAWDGSDDCASPRPRSQGPRSHKMRPGAGSWQDEIDDQIDGTISPADSGRPERSSGLSAQQRKKAARKLRKTAPSDSHDHAHSVNHSNNNDASSDAPDEDDGVEYLVLEDGEEATVLNSQTYAVRTVKGPVTLQLAPEEEAYRLVATGSEMSYSTPATEYSTYTPSTFSASASSYDIPGASSSSSSYSYGIPGASSFSTSNNYNIPMSTSPPASSSYNIPTSSSSTSTTSNTYNIPTSYGLATPTTNTSYTIPLSEGIYSAANSNTDLYNIPLGGAPAPSYSINFNAPAAQPASYGIPVMEGLVDFSTHSHNIPLSV